MNIERPAGAFEIFARSESKEFFERVKYLFDISNPGDLEPVFNAFQEGRLKIPSWD
jgi:hypothetical protein